jgi:hypothetical protein
LVTVLKDIPGDAERAARTEGTVEAIINIAPSEAEAIERAVAEVKIKNPMANHPESRVTAQALRIGLEELRRAVAALERGELASDDDGILDAQLIE